MLTKLGVRDWYKTRKRIFSEGYLLGYQWYGCGAFICLDLGEHIKMKLRAKGIVFFDTFDEWKEHLENWAKNWKDWDLLMKYNIRKYQYLKEKYLFIVPFIKRVVGDTVKEKEFNQLKGAVIKRLQYRKYPIFYTPFGIYTERGVESVLYELITSSKILKKEGLYESRAIEKIS